MIIQNTSPPTREDPQTAGPRLFGTHTRRAPALVRRAGLGQASPPNLVPNCGVQGEPRTKRCDEHCYIRLVRRAACHDRRHLRHRKRCISWSILSSSRFFSLCTQSPVSCCTSRSIAMREKLNLHLCSTYKTDENAATLELPTLVVSFENTMQYVFGFDFHSSTRPPV